MRVLVTGARGWTDRNTVGLALIAAREMPDDPYEEMVLVSGHCPDGFDAIMEHVAGLYDWTIETHPADWSTGKGAGFARNAHMVSLGADLCIVGAMPCEKPGCTSEPKPHLTHGTAHCAGLAQAADIPVRYCTQVAPEPPLPVCPQCSLNRGCREGACLTFGAKA